MATPDPRSAAPHSDLPLCDNPECTRADHLIGATRSPYTESEQRMLRFIDAISPFIEDVLDQPFPWKSGGQVITWMSREQYDEALEALNALRD